MALKKVSKTKRLSLSGHLYVEMWHNSSLYKALTPYRLYLFSKTQYMSLFVADLDPEAVDAL